MHSLWENWDDDCRCDGRELIVVVREMPDMYRTSCPDVLAAVTVLVDKNCPNILLHSPSVGLKSKKKKNCDPLRDNSGSCSHTPSPLTPLLKDMYLWIQIIFYWVVVDEWMAEAAKNLVFSVTSQNKINLRSKVSRIFSWRLLSTFIRHAPISVERINHTQFNCSLCKFYVLQ